MNQKLILIESAAVLDFVVEDMVIVSVILITVFIGAVDFVFNKMLQFFAQNI